MKRLFICRSLALPLEVRRSRNERKNGGDGAATGKHGGSGARRGVAVESMALQRMNSPFTSSASVLQIYRDARLHSKEVELYILV